MKYTGRFTAIILSFVLLFGLQLTGCAYRHTYRPLPSGPVQHTDFEVSFGFFHNSLSPYGNWVSIGSYGPCWRPANLASDWQPYFNEGYWAYTSYGWTWVSLNPWGEIVFHYGSWYYDPFYGWVWAPGYIWGPAWVTWMHRDGYIGWAPLPPTFRFDHHHDHHDFVKRPIVVNNQHYVFVPSEQIVSTNLKTFRLPREKSIEMARLAQPVTTINVANNQVINQGPELPALENIRRKPTPIEEISQQARTQPKSLQISTTQAQLELASPSVNRQEAKRVIKDAEQQEHAARLDRERQQGVVNQPKTELPNVKPQPELKKQRQLENQERQQQQQQLHQEQKDRERIRKQQDQQYRQQEQLRHQQERQQQRQQNQTEKQRRQQERQQNRGRNQPVEEPMN